MCIKQLLLNSAALLTATAFFAPKGFAQNSVVISQSGGAGNSAVVSQSGQGGSVVISQDGAAVGDSSGLGTGNRVSLHVAKGTQTTVSQHNTGPNSVAIAQDGRSTAVISQSSGTGENTVVTLPNPEPVRPDKRRNRRP